ncbi:MAG: RDD family protein, partial [Candidatus Acidiferrum sp.]
GSSEQELAPPLKIQGNLALDADVDLTETIRAHESGADPQECQGHAAWHGELTQRVHAYRARKRKLAPNSSQPQLPFENPREQSTPVACAALEDQSRPVDDDFSFTIAIGRPGRKRECDETRMLIDVSGPSEAIDQPRAEAPSARYITGLYPVASIEERRLAGLIDTAFLLFAYGGFLALFGSLGLQFNLSKLSTLVYASSFIMFYLQYFALFTIFGGTTPGMMLRGLHVASFSGESPTPRQMFLRSAGYLLSAGTFFLGFLWAVWDEDALTWHDRVSKTYLSSAETFSEIEAASAAHSR